ncbi:hypothetical protein [uncultured Fibrobacter sp.]|uniref:ImmA/IrrE family metallo-endopeptidase n=1 Tax=uncultured Fibrobacter sp. TaxID=261512 RepID=UPI00280503D6|nr:hypothetical protein [uncultured Fibrobacter sp.]
MGESHKNDGKGKETMNIKDYSDERLDFFGDELNRRFDISRLEEAKPLDVYDVVESIGCTPDWKYITPDQSILGMTVFETTNFYKWENPFFHQSDMPKEIVLKKGTILIDRTLNEGNRQKQQIENFTVIHECFHWLLHRRYFETSDSSPYLCCTEDSLFGKTSRLDEKIRMLEHQANRCAASFLLPRQAVSNEFMKTARLKNFPQHPMPLQNMKSHIAKTATLFSVNFNPMKYRLQELGFIQK